MFSVEKWPKETVKLPDGVRMVLAMSVAFESEEDHTFLDSNNTQIDYLDFYERQYGGRRGVWRVLEALTKNEITSTFVIPGAIVENYPDACLAAKEAGHEIAAHSYHHEHFELMTTEEEDEAFMRMMAAFDDLYGEKPLGFRTCFPSHRTIDFVQQYGFRYDTTHRDEDLPYVLEWEDGRTLLEIPRNVNGDAHLMGTPARQQWSMGSGKFNEPQTVADHWKREFLACYERGAHSTQIMGLTLHPFASGHPSRIKAVNDFFAYTRQFPGVWYATHAELSDLWLKHDFTEVVNRTSTAYSDKSSAE